MPRRPGRSVCPRQPAVHFLGEGDAATVVDCGDQGVADTVSPARSAACASSTSPISRTRSRSRRCRRAAARTRTRSCRIRRTGRTSTSIVSGTAGVRSPSELAGCSDVSPDKDPNTSLFRIDVIQVPLAHPEQAHVVNKPRILGGLAVRRTTRRDRRRLLDNAARMAAMAAAGTARGGSDGRGARPPRAPSGRSNATTSRSIPAVGLAAGACSRQRPPARHQRSDATRSASTRSPTRTSRTGTRRRSTTTARRCIFTDEWGGGTQPRCRATDPLNWGADAIFDIVDTKLTFGGLLQDAGAADEQENCVAHNGSLDPGAGARHHGAGLVSGRRRRCSTSPIRPSGGDRVLRSRPDRRERSWCTGGYWSAYWYNGHIYGSEIARGIDIFELTPSEYSLAERDRRGEAGAHRRSSTRRSSRRSSGRRRSPVARAYLDQLARSNGLAADKIAAARSSLDAAEKASGSQRASALTKAATTLEASASGAADAHKVGLVVAAMRDLAKAKG